MSSPNLIAAVTFHGSPICLSDRFFHSSLAGQNSVKLDGAEAHHLIHVLRAKPGLEVTLFDGSGAEFLSRVALIERSAVHIAIVERREVDRELRVSLTLGVALPKGDRQRWLIEKVTELGVAQMVPLITSRSVAQPTGDALRRLGRAVIEASKQCGRNRLMQVAEPKRWSDYVDVVSAFSPEPKTRAGRLFAHPGGSALTSTIVQLLREPHEIHLAVGPEGGFTDAEAQQAIDAGWQAVDLGGRILRVETAALALVAAVTLPGV